MTSFLNKLQSLKPGGVPKPVVSIAAPPLNPTPTPTAATAPRVAPEASAPAAGAAEAPPWADSSCRACAGAGFSTDGTPCRICDHRAQAAGRPTSAMFVIEAVGDGTFIWEPKAGTAAGTGQAGSSPTPSANAQVVSQEKVAPGITAKEEVKEGDVVSTEGTNMTAKQGRGRPKGSKNKVAGEEIASAAPAAAYSPKISAGFVLCVNCAPQGKDGEKRYFLHDVLEQIGVELAAQAKVEHYTLVDVFQRRDFITQAGKAIADGFGNDYVIASGIGTGASDLRSLFDAIRPFAADEIHPDGTV